MHFAYRGEIQGVDTFGPHRVREPFAAPRIVSAISSFAEAPALSPDGRFPVALAAAYRRGASKRLSAAYPKALTGTRLPAHFCRI
ncbi:MAG TPA: hypothetical protein VN924_32885 [Bryobacteraceae bacterium]|nr:hypothetical protein [Bryobacteraceae bacterium]